MNIIEVKNNLVKLTYDEELALASFIKITDLKNTYIAQILHLESSRIGKIAIARLIFNYKGTVQAYDGSVPSIQSEIEILNDDFVVNILDKSDPMLIGKIAQKDTNVIVSAKMLKDKPIICAEKSYQYTQLLENIIQQNELNSRKTVVIDITGEVKGNKITAAEDFKIPLDKNSIGYIFDRGFNDLTDEYKAFIQDIFSELNAYIKTVEYIPFNDFNMAVDYEFKQSQQLQLIILKNKLLQFEKAGIFAQEENDFRILDKKLQSDNTLVIDLSRLNDSLQKEYILYIYNQMEKQNINFYTVTALNNNNSDKEVLNKIFASKNVFTSIVCPYSYKYIEELKQCSKNMIMFTPMKQQNDFGAYNIFLNKLAEDEFILYGKSTKFVPLIIKLEEIEMIDEIMPEPQPIEEHENIPVVGNMFKQIVKEEEPVMEMPAVDEPIIEEPVEELTEDEQVIEEEPVMEMPAVDEPIIKEPVEEITEDEQIIEEEPVMEMPAVDEPIIEEPVEELTEDEQIIEEEPVMEMPAVDEPIMEEEPVEELTEDEQIMEEEPVMEEPVNESEEEIQTVKLPKEDANLENMANEVQKELMGLSIDIDDDEIPEAISAPPPLTEEEVTQSLDPSDLFKSNEPEEDDTALTDADLDMIESLEEEKKNPIEESEPIDDVIENVPEQEEIEPEPVTATDEEIVEETAEQTTSEEPVTESKPEIIEDTEIASEEPQTEPRQPSITEQILMEDAQKAAEEEANKPDPVEEQIEKPIEKKHDEKLETKTSQTPIVPVYSAEIPDEDIVESDNIQQGDQIVHAEFGRGIVEKIINYGDRKLCSVNFEQVGRRLLDPKISEMKKV